MGGAYYLHTIFIYALLTGTAIIIHLGKFLELLKILPAVFFLIFFNSFIRLCFKELKWFRLLVVLTILLSIFGSLTKNMDYIHKIIGIVLALGPLFIITVKMEDFARLKNSK